MSGAAASLKFSRRFARPASIEPPNGIEPLTFSLPWKRSAD